MDQTRHNAGTYRVSWNKGKLVGQKPPLKGAVNVTGSRLQLVA